MHRLLADARLEDPAAGAHAARGRGSLRAGLLAAAHRAPLGGTVRLVRRYRAGGADLPFRDPGAAHGTPFEGYFWRIVDPASGAVVIALSGVCAGPEGPWGMSTLAAHPGGFARTLLTRTAAADPHVFGVRAEAVLHGDAAAVSVDMGPDARMAITLHDVVGWPSRAFGALGLAHAVPRLPQYWHPVVLTAAVRGHVRAGELALELDGAVGYAEKNWGHGFPDRWWWGHASFGDADVSVSFAGGRVAPARGVEVAPTAVVLRLGSRVIALAPPLATTRVALGAGAWRLRTRGRGYTVEIDGDAGDVLPHELLVPVPAQVHGELRSRQHLAGSLALRVRRGRRLLYEGRSAQAGLEVELPVSHPRHGARQA